MICLVQLVSRASVSVDQAVTGAIGPGMLVLACAQPNDTPQRIQWMANKLAKLRVFSDEQGKMNHSLLDTQGEVLVVSQFTLAAETQSGNRPSFSKAAPPELGQAMVESLIQNLQALGLRVQQGVFGASMQVSLVNEGPATFWITNKD